MIKVESRITWNNGVLERFKAAAEVNSVAVGYSPDQREPDGEPTGQVARTQEFGTPKIPPRPWIRPTIDRRKGHWGREVMTGLKMFKTKDRIRKMWEDRGKAIVVNLQQAIDRVYTPPLAPYTIEKRKARGNDSTKPLIDSGTMRNEIKFKVAGGEWQK